MLRSWTKNWCLHKSGKFRIIFLSFLQTKFTLSFSNDSDIPLLEILHLSWKKTTNCWLPKQGYLFSTVFTSITFDTPLAVLFVAHTYHSIPLHIAHYFVFSLQTCTDFSLLLASATIWRCQLRRRIPSWTCSCTSCRRSSTSAGWWLTANRQYIILLFFSI